MLINNHFTSFASFSSMSKLHMQKTQSVTSIGNFFGANASSLMKSAQNFVSVTTVQMTRISVTMSAFTSSSRTLYDNKTAVSGDPDLLEIKSHDGKGFQDKKVKIDQIATSQQNTGKMMNVNANPGTQKDSVYRFEIEVDGERHELSFEVDHKETNKGFQQKMADAVNAAGIGVTASVITDKDGKNSMLSLESKATGANESGGPHFTVRDIQGNAVEYTGVGTAAQEAKDAVFSVNGEKRTSKSNDVDLGDGVTATLKKASDKEISVTLQKDTQAMLDGMHTMVNSYNKILEAARNNQGDKHTRMFMMSFELTVVSSRTVLKEVGVNADEKGFLSVDSKKMKEAAESGAIERFFTGEKATGRGFIGQLGKLINDFHKNPWQFVSPALGRLPMHGTLIGDNGFNGSSPFELLHRMLDIKG
ncbi:MAG: flagellar filament capping protein FliD [Defluviitaleaceae bacterium]|nr:flagellar filament capping protein FliD [Defluviitaleaceae bacterium]MCL2835439.1 flagellar filament capping protein FliD [Defluviitaleaceae bacterium]